MALGNYSLYLQVVCKFKVKFTLGKHYPEYQSCLVILENNKQSEKQ